MDPFAKLFDDYPLTHEDKHKLPAPQSPSAPASSSTFASAAHLFALPPSSAPVSSSSPAPAREKKMRRLPRDIIKKGEYGPEYEEWRRKQEEEERRAAEAVLRGPEETSAPVMVPAKTGPSKKKREGGPPRGSRIKVEVVERGVPKKQWFLIKWMAEEDKTSEDDAIVLFEEDLKLSNEVWSLSLTHRKPRGSTHCQRESKIGRFFAAYVKLDGSVRFFSFFFRSFFFNSFQVLCRSSTVLIGPKVMIRAEVKGLQLLCKYRMEKKEEMSSWDWIGVFHSTQEENYADYVTWIYVDVANEVVTLETPVTPGDYVCCYFSAAKKYCPMAFSNFVTVPDANELFLSSGDVGQFKPGSKISFSVNIKSHSRESGDWVGLYKYHEHKKHLYLASAVVGKAPSGELMIPEMFSAECATGFVLRYVSLNASPLSSGTVITTSAPFQIGIKQ